MSKTRLCRPSLLSSKPCRDYTAAASIRDLLQRVHMRMRLLCCRCKASLMLHAVKTTKLMHLQDTSLPPDITDNLEQCAAALEKTAVAAGATLPSAAQARQLFAKEQQHANSQPAQTQPKAAAAADGVKAQKPTLTAAAAAATLPDGSAGAAAGEGVQQGKRKKAKRKSEQSAAVTPDAAPDTPAHPGAAQPTGVPATDANQPSTSQSVKKKHEKGHPASGADATDSASAERSSEQAAAARSTPGHAAAADVQTPATSKKKRKKEAAAALEQQNGQAAHGSAVADVAQAANGSTGKKHKKRKKQEPDS